MTVELSTACEAYNVTDVNCIKIHHVMLYLEYRNYLIHKMVLHHKALTLHKLKLIRLYVIKPFTKMMFVS